MHKLLERQLKRAFGASPPRGLEAFFRTVDEAYQAADQERTLVERSLELMSRELTERNQQLRSDIAAQRAIEAELRRREVEFRDLIGGLPQVILVRRGTRCLFVNQAGYEALKYPTAAALSDVPVLELVHPDDRAVVAAQFEAMDQGGAYAGPSQVRLVRLDGETATLELGLQRLIVFEGQPAVLLAAQDVTEKKKLEARLQLADRMASVGTLAAGVAHEINNPLAYVLANVDFASDRLGALPETALGADGDEVRAALSEALQGAKRVREIVQGMKIFSRTEEDRRGPVDLASVLDSSISIVGNELRHRARLTKAYQPVPPVMGNAGRLGQVFVNILVNAAQAIHEGAANENEIAIGLSQQGGQVKVIIRDTGSGMSPEVQRRIFDPFFTTKEVGVGSGLGLAICHGIIASHGGEIQVESQPKRGTTFSMLLPLADAPAPTVLALTPRRRSEGPRRRVLVVDDEPMVGRSIRRTLSEHEVEVVTNGADALKKLHAGEHFEVIFCDLMMPQMTGIDLHGEVNALWPELAENMIFLTGGAFTPKGRAFLDQVPNRRLIKPFDTDELRVMVAGSGPEQTALG